MGGQKASSDVGACAGGAVSWYEENNVLRLLRGMCLAVVALMPPQVCAETVDEFYRGKIVTLVVGADPGAGFDIFSRLLARHLGKYLPGHPNIIVRNMPGAGGLLAVNYLYSVAPKDGATFGLIFRNMPMLGLIGQNSNVRFDPRKFTWLGSSSSFSNDAYVLIVRKDAPAKSIEDVRSPVGPPLVLGGTAEGASSADVPKILRDTLGLNLNLILGYRDGTALYLGMERGELNGRMVELSAVRATRPNWLKPDSDYRILVQYARITRHPDLPDVPTARELAPNGSARALIEFTETPLLTMAWPFAAPPGIPEDRARALQDAFAAAHRDPQYLEEAAAAGVEVNPVSAEDVVASIDRLSRAPPDIFEYVRKLIAGRP
jgi:tripartite-type tricarboxylate transporter receptor subunit TctC